MGKEMKQKEKTMTTNCDTCGNFVYDEEDEEYYCDINMDEDDMARLLSNPYSSCPFYQNGDEYKIVRKQM